MRSRTNENKKYFLYARKSSENEDRQVQSIDDQIKVLKELAARLDIEIVAEFTEAKSAKTPYKRAVFSNMLKRIEKGEASGILCWKLDRLARNPVDAGSITWLLQSGIIAHIKTHDSSFYPTDNVLLMSVEFGIANQYIIDLKKNVRRGLQGRAERGWFPGLATVGYINNKEEHTIVVDKKRFALMRRMWDLMLTGNYTPPQIQEIANNEWGFRTKRHKKIGGVPLAPCALYRVFTNIFYAGMFEWGGKLYQGKHKPMITLDEYDRVQIILGKHGKPRAQTHEFSYTGLITCGECGCMVTATEKRKLVKKTNSLKSYIYYHCTKKRKDIKCKQKPIRWEDLEQQILKKLEKYTIDPSFGEWTKEVVNELRTKEIEAVQKVVAMRQQSLDKTQKELNNLTQMRIRDLIDDDTFMREQVKLQNAIVRLKNELQQSSGQSAKWLDLTESAFTYAANAKQAFENGSVKMKRAIFNALGSNFSLKDGKLLFEAIEWLVKIEIGYPPLRAVFKRLELIKAPYFSTDNIELRNAFRTMRALVEDVRTILENMALNKEIPHLCQLGQPEHPPPEATNRRD